MFRKCQCLFKTGQDIMFVRPRPKKSTLPPPPKRRKTQSRIEEINFDFEARQEYLTGFHKRKLQRAKAAQEQNAKRAREERLLQRKQLREERRQELEAHVKQINDLLKPTTADSDESGDEAEDEPWDGIQDETPVEVVDHEAEYVDEDRYTTVTVEAVEVSKDGLHRSRDVQSSEEDSDGDQEDAASRNRTKPVEVTTKKAPKKEKKKKFRYESKAERKVKRDKQMAGKKLRAARRHSNG